MGTIPDVDLDLPDRGKALSLFPQAVPASQLNHKGTDLVRHNTGVYLQDVPTDPITGLATFPYDMAEDRGYYKLDLIPYNVYDGVKSEAHLKRLLKTAESDSFPWEWFEEDRFYTGDERITHLGKHFETVKMYPPETVEEVAALIALIRPRKKYLIGEPWDVIAEKIWLNLPEEEEPNKPGNYFFKKSHAIAFALVIMVHIQILDSRMKGAKDEIN